MISLKNKNTLKNTAKLYKNVLKVRLKKRCKADADFANLRLRETALYNKEHHPW